MQIGRGGLREGVVLDMARTGRQRAPIREVAIGTMTVTDTDRPSTPRPRTDLSSQALYFNRELSWLEFNARVLELAEDESIPLLERVKFCAIVSINLDEFFMVRVAGLHDQIEAGSRSRCRTAARRARRSTRSAASSASTSSARAAASS